MSDSDTDGGEYGDEGMNVDPSDGGSSMYSEGLSAASSRRRRRRSTQSVSSRGTRPTRSEAGFSMSGISEETSVTSASSVSNRTRTPSPIGSLISLDESLADYLYKEEFGRQTNNHSDAYLWPCDEEETDRLGRWPPATPRDVKLT